MSMNFHIWFSDAKDRNIGSLDVNQTPTTATYKLFEGFPEHVTGDDAKVVLERYFERERKMCDELGDDGDYVSMVCESNIEFIRKQIALYENDYTFNAGIW